MTLSLPGIYIVTLENEQPISVNAHDPRIAAQCIRVTKANCKVGKAKSLVRRKRNYEKTFGHDNVVFHPLALIEKIASAEKLILMELDDYRIRGSTGRKNEWLEGIEPQEAYEKAITALNNAGMNYELIENPFLR